MNEPKAGAADVFSYSLWKTAVFVAVLTVLTLVPLAAALSGQAGFGFALLFGMTAAFFAVWLAAMLARFLWRGPVLVISPEGVLDRRIGPKTIPWERITQIYVFRARSQVYIAVLPDDPEDFVHPPGRFERLSLWAADALKLPRFSISMMGLDASQRSIMKALRRHMPAGIYQEPERFPRGI